MEFRLLKKEEIEIRVGNIISTPKWQGYSLLLFKNARADMNILDETVGVENWQRKHYEVKGNMYCSVGININWNKDKEPYFIWKDDCGTESFTEKEKGESSDAFKRACVNWGIGRELYTAPRNMLIPCQLDEKGKLPKSETFRRFFVQEITYTKDRKIDGLIICDAKTGKVVYQKIKTENNETVEI